MSTPLDSLAREASKKMVARVKAAISVRGPVRRRRREPGEVPTLRVAIMSNCSECLGFGEDSGMGTVAQQVRDCEAVKCWLWPWRNGKLDASLLADETPGTLE